MKKVIKKWIKRLSAIEKDRYQHFSVGAVLAAMVLLAGYALIALSGVVPCAGTRHVIGRWIPLSLSVAVVASAALVKEHCLDERSDPYDVIATMAGGAVVWMVFLII